MVMYAIGDIQGCFDVLQRLLRRLHFDARRDVLCGCGDMVNRGPKSLETLQLLQDLGPSFAGVLGNHELFLLACAFGILSPSKKDTVQPILAARHSAALIDWLLQRPLLLCFDACSVVHAGLHPSWTLPEAAAWAALAHTALSSQQRAGALLRRLFGRPEQPHDQVAPGLVQAVQCMTMMRVCDAQGRLLLRFNGPPAAAPPTFAPWFSWPHRRPAAHTVVCGHWAALGKHRAAGVVGLDSGCVWGNELTAMALPQGDFISEPADPKTEPPMT
ncbi:MAG: symmetrical bis(5'-nucleosyl)-tetraphosphatase [Deltaproteobacteria bacterium]|nr:MAG: symmetrical bis(5'-nucleosyl)-tetraphosphatase [Deltaproteobacteria bacterium]